MKNWAYTIFSVPTTISILLGLLLILWQNLNAGLPPSVQMAFFAVLLFATGIPHGAIDHLVEAETAKRQNKSFHLPMFLLKYLATMAFYGLVWYALPSTSLAVFLLISAWHFGETDIEKAPATHSWNITRFIFGTLVLTWILLSHVEETQPILERISNNNSNVMAIWSFMTLHIQGTLIFFLTVFIIAFTTAYSKHPLRFDKFRLFRLLILLVITHYLPLLPAFALYFCGWHSLCAFKTIQDYLAYNQKSRDKNYGILKFAFSIWSKTLLFTLMAFSSLSFATWYWLHYLNTWDPLPLLFIFLSLVTLPHLNVMHGMNKEVYESR
jgi:beta-carotene 15,15'-dioxygenase